MTQGSERAAYLHLRSLNGETTSSRTARPALCPVTTTHPPPWQENEFRSGTWERHDGDWHICGRRWTSNLIWRTAATRTGGQRRKCLLKGISRDCPACRQRFLWNPNLEFSPFFSDLKCFWFMIERLLPPPPQGTSKDYTHCSLTYLKYKYIW